MPISITKTESPQVKKFSKESTDILSKKFNEFYESKWDSNYMYTPSDFIDEFGINRHLARYYLMDMVYEKKLFRVKYANKTFYGKRSTNAIDKFKEFVWMGVEVTC